MATVHFVLQGKGGVGKTYVSSVLTQYLLQKGLKISCMDIDHVNHTLAGYKEFEAAAINIMDADNDVDPRKFDALIEIITKASPEQNIVIDTGASTFSSFLHYINDNAAFETIEESGHQIYLHTIIVGGQGMMDSLNGLESLCANFPKVPIVIWLNLYFGEIRQNEKRFGDFEIYDRYKNRFFAFITIPNKDKRTFGRDIEELLASKQSFAAGINSSLPIMVRQRLKVYWKELSAAIDQANLV
jgi:hypothetical protein